MSKLWGGRFAKELAQEVADFSSSLSLDLRLWPADIAGCLAHARMLGKQGILSEVEASQIIAGLSAVRDDIAEAFAAGTSPFQVDAEDIHSEIERLLTLKIGPVAGRLHTARSRNDQVATACRMTLAHESAELSAEILALQRLFVTLAENETETLLPGLTHFQHAQPVSLAHHLLAYVWMFQRDRERLAEFQKRTLTLPLGAAALAGTSFPIDREMVAHELGFHAICENSLDAVSDRDFVIELLSDCSMLMMHLSRLSEEVIIWSAPEHGFLILDDSVTTGSSIMPQKKNPDVAELIRGRCGRAVGALNGALMMMKGLPLAYNRDLQEDKFHAFQGVDVARSSVRLMRQMFESAVFQRARMRESLAGDFSNATDLADDLARKGLPFREAHEVVGRIVRHCLDKGLRLEDATLTDLQPFHRLIDAASVACLAHEAVVNARTSRGGTSPSAAREQLARARALLD